MSDSWDRIREHPEEGNLRFDSFYCEVSGRCGHPSIDASQRQPSEDWLVKARETCTWGSNSRFERLVGQVSRFFDW